MGMLDAPSQIAVYGDRVYFMLNEDPSVWSAPKAGGTVEKVVSGPPYQLEHGEVSLGLWAEECGLAWLHGNSADPATLQFMPWK